jgi:hypothetical protein
LELLVELLVELDQKLVGSQLAAGQKPVSLQAELLSELLREMEAQLCPEPKLSLR